MADFDRCLRTLHEDPEQATYLYLDFHRKLLMYFDSNHCHDSVSCACTVMDRFCEIASKTSVASPRSLIFSIAWHVRHECWRSQKREQEVAQELITEASAGGDPSESEVEHAKAECWRRCLAQIPAKDRALIKRYNTPANGEKLYTTRRKLAAQVGRTLPELRKKILEVRSALRQCFERCIAEGRERAVDPKHE